jgi:hypothetical protein
MWDKRIVEVEIHDGETASHVVVTAQSPTGDGFMIVHATFEEAPLRNDASAYKRYSLINPVVEMAWQRAKAGKATGYGSHWSYYLTDRIEHWKPGSSEDEDEF